MTAPKRIDLAGIGAGVAKALEAATIHQVKSVNVELDEQIDGTRSIGISALIIIPAGRRAAAADDASPAEEEPDTVDARPARRPRLVKGADGTPATKDVYNPATDAKAGPAEQLEAITAEPDGETQP